MRVTLIYNPTAGGEARDGAALRSRLESAGHAVRAASVKDSGWKQLLGDPGELVVAAGGDGTVRKVFKELATSDVDVTVLPLGSANNIARTLGLADVGVGRLVAGLADGGRRRFDLGEAAARWGETTFVESFGGGLFAEVLARADRVDTKDEGKVEVGLRLLADVLRDAPALEWELQVDGVDASGPYLGVEAMNIRETGPNVPLAAQADPGDGRLDVVRIRAEDRTPLLEYIDGRLRGARPEVPQLPVLLGSRVFMTPSAGCLLRADDELWPDDAAPQAGDRVTIAAGSLTVRLVEPVLPLGRTHAAKLLGVGDEVDLEDPAFRDREADHGDRASTRDDE